MNRRHLLTKLFTTAGVFTLPWSSNLWAMGEDKLQLGQLKWTKKDDAWNLRPTALRRLLQDVEKRTSVAIKAEGAQVELGKSLFEYPLVFLSGARAMEPWTQKQRETLRTYLDGGGMLVVDSSEGVKDGPFIKSVIQELEQVFPKKKLTPLPSEHVLFKSFYLLDKPYGRTMVAKQFQAIVSGDRVQVLLSTNDMLGAWARDGFGRWEYDVVPGGERQREWSFRMGINLVMYALCVNYKADQVHIPFILKRRQWRVK